MKFKYKCITPTLPSGATSPAMDSRQMEDWLNEQGESGWEFAGYAEKRWLGSEQFIQSWWIFKKNAG